MVTTSPWVMSTCGWSHTVRVKPTYWLYSSHSQWKCPGCDSGTTTRVRRTRIEGSVKRMLSRSLPPKCSAYCILSEKVLQVVWSTTDHLFQAKQVHITLDDRQVSPPEGFLIRKGPGNCFFDFAQEVSFTEPQTPRVSAPSQEAQKSLKWDF